MNTEMSALVISREQKAEKIMAVLTDHFSEKLESMVVLDVGCHFGIISCILGREFNKVIGFDIDEYAIKQANKTCKLDNVSFIVQDSLHLGLQDERFDVVICNHVYEHVSDSKLLISEIERILKPRGICYFAAPNRWNLIEPHYKIPLLTILPKFIADTFVRISGKGEQYYVKFVTLKKLQDIVSHFDIIDYTKKIIAEPDKYAADDVIAVGTLKHKIAKIFSNKLYQFMPTYIWLLRKKQLHK
jgi:2-polyprenyl-3-methyl-5-hydroxy-6-metoxy-1,4-benzoquinol methylase